MRKKVIGFALCAMLLTLSFPAQAQQAGKVPRVGIIYSGSPSASAPLRDAFQQGLGELGYIEGQNIKIDYRFGDGREDRIPEFAMELVRLKVDVIVAFSHRVALTLKKTITAIPVVFAMVNDPVGIGLVPSLARPGRNITGVSLQGLDLIGKRLELLKESIPKVNRLAYLRNPTEPYSPAYWQEVQSTSRALGIRQVSSFEVKGSEDYERAFAAMRQQRPDALLVEPNSLNSGNRNQISEFAIDHRLPTMAGLTYFNDAGALMSYGPNLTEHFHRAAVYVDKILKGAKPADLPVEQPTKFELVINLKTAKALNLTIPQSVLFRADRVIK
jgi:putative ABC transport system substrate-binding protein